MSIVKEFREFAVKGNVIDLAVGVVIGAAFGKIVTSLVADLIMPPIGVLVGGVNFTSLKLTLKEAIDKDHPAVTLNYGNFLQTMFDFLIIAVAIFALVKVINRLKRMSERPAPPPPAGPTREVELLTEIRDALVKRT
jgi:large conductance mechanosensitive channel